MSRHHQNIILRGGLDIVSSPLIVDPGRLWTCVNYEPADGGYRRIRGYERFDGRLRPSEAEYWMLAFDGDVTAAPDPGDTITGQTSTATAVVLKTVDGEYVIGELDDAFDDDEGLNASGAAGTVSGGSGITMLERRLGAPDVVTDLEYRDLAAAHRRTTIAAVPGSGHVRGVWAFEDAVYAFRDNAIETAGVMHKATPTGWEVVMLGHSIGFDAGAVEPTVGEMVTGATSAATARLGAVVLGEGIDGLTPHGPTARGRGHVLADRA